MPSGWLVLQRFFLRVDHVLFRVFDTRLYVSFHPQDGERDGAHVCPRVIRECRGIEASYNDVLRYLPVGRAQDLSLLTNVTWVAETLDKIAARQIVHGAHMPMPASVPQDAHVPGATIVDVAPGEQESDAWEGQGYCIQVAVLRPG